ncbi:hypothetical protein BDB01DRAFT_799224 [Pilobolus umbonatus]|nr:hypothetical protein BDB01DRAFT_814436 [Pilobolus umbonatus]KAI8978560.1 hypothetical protein BDB01DRAFT_799224 [Pilobolus umbonatus]
MSMQNTYIKIICNAQEGLCTAVYKHSVTVLYIPISHVLLFIYFPEYVLSLNLPHFLSY